MTHTMSYLKLYLLTWNCGRAFVEEAAFAKHLFDGWQDPSADVAKLPDAIVLNIQEIAPLSHAFLGGSFVTPYFDHFRKAVGLASTSAKADFNYVNVISRNCGLTALMLFIRDDFMDDVTSIMAAEVGVGLSQMGNKGAVGVRVGWKVPKMDQALYTTFVSAHLAAFEEEMERRDQDYKDIIAGLVFTGQDAREWRKSQTSDEQVPLLAGTSVDSDESHDQGVYADDTHLFVSGDLNYRTGMTGPAKEDAAHYPQPTSDVKSAIHYRQLLGKDQLTQQLHAGKTLHGLTEQKIDFPPTYKLKLNVDKPVILDQDTDAWEWSTHRWPSWCDRILFSATPSLHVVAGKYSSLPIFRTTDHRPVALSAAVALKPISDTGFSKLAPVSINADYHSRRNAARRQEIAVGLAAYLSTTYEGAALVFGTAIMVVGAIYILKSMSTS